MEVILLYVSNNFNRILYKSDKYSTLYLLNLMECDKKIIIKKKCNVLPKNIVNGLLANYAVSF